MKNFIIAVAVLLAGLLFYCPKTYAKGFYETEISVEEMVMLAQIVRAEAGNQCLEGKKAVVDVVLNRLYSDKFPNTIEEVIFQERQFSCVKDGNFDAAAYNLDKTDHEAVISELRKRKDTEILYFSSGECYNGEFVYKIQDHYFAK